MAVGVPDVGVPDVRAALKSTLRGMTAPLSSLLFKGDSTWGDKIACDAEAYE